MAFLLVENEIELSVAKQKLQLPQCGGYVAFEGWVRNMHQGKAVDKLIYSAYPKMAVAMGEKILAEARQNFAIEAAYCLHRIGELAIGDMAVWVGVSAPHRGAAFKACQFIVDTLKQDVPIWKHEFYQDGSSAWVLNHHC